MPAALPHIKTKSIDEIRPIRKTHSFQEPDIKLKPEPMKDYLKIVETKREIRDIEDQIQKQARKRPNVQERINEAGLD